LSQPHTQTRRSFPQPPAKQKKSGLKDQLMGAPLKLKLALVVILLVAVTAALGIRHHQQSQENVALFAYPLTSLQLQECSQRLSQLGIEHQPNSEQTNLMVSPQRRLSLLSQLSLEGLPHEDSIKPSTPFTASRREQLLKSQAELQMRLAGSLRSLQGIEQASVQLAIPESTLGEEQHPSASVLLKLRSGYEMNRTQAQGVARFVAAAVPELRAADVTVLDDTGRELSSQEGGALGDVQLELQKQFDVYLSGKAQRMLDLAYGRGGALAIVNVQLDFSQIEVKRTDVGRPGQGEVLQVVQKVDERYENHNSSSLLGDSDEPPKDGKKYAKESIAERHKADEAFTWTVHRLPRLDRLTCSVLIEDKGQEATALSLVQGAIGFDAGRGDSILVKCVPLSRASGALKDIAPAPQSEELAQSPSWMPIVGLAGALALLGVGGICWLGQRQLKREQKRQELSLAGVAPPTDLADLSRGKSGQWTRDTQTQPQVLLRLEELARQQPHKTVSKLRTYIDSL
jgi:flagellar M-ring protein FliF